MRPLRPVQRACRSPRAVPAVLALALLLCTPSIGTGLFADDHLQRLMAGVGADTLAGFPERPHDLFVFTDGSPEVLRAGQEEGLFGWWAVEEHRLAFFRPLSVLSHWLDYTLWPDAPWLMHAHNLVWYALLLLVVVRLFRRFVPTPWVATLAFALYALDDAHAMPVAWVAHRNAMIALTLGFGALLAHDRWRRDGWSAGALVGPALFAVALLAAEAAVATGGFLLAHAVTLDPARGRRRLAPLVPYLAIGAGYVALHHALGYGTHGSGVYIDPVGAPLAFLARVAEHLPVLLQGQLGGIPADIWIGLPSAARFGLFLPLYLGFLLWLGVVAWPVLRDHAHVRFFALGLVLALVPSCATFPSDRLLLCAGLGGAGLVAAVLAHALEVGVPRLHARVLVAALAITHLVLGPLGMPLDARAVAALGDVVARADGSLPSDPSVREDTVVVLSVPLEPASAYAPAHRASVGTPRPAHRYTLAVSPHAVTVTVVDDHTLRVAPEGGFLSTNAEQMLRDPARYPMQAGHEVRLDEMTVRVTEVDPTGRPLVIEARFVRPLDDPHLRLFRWQGLALTAWSPPETGTSETFPAVDPLLLLLGIDEGDPS